MRSATLTVGIYIGIIVVALATAAHIKAQGPQPPLVSPTSVSVPSSYPDDVTFVAVPVPLDIHISEKETQKLLVDLLGLKLLPVDNVFVAHHVRIKDGGVVVFDPATGRPQQ